MSIQLSADQAFELIYGVAPSPQEKLRLHELLGGRDVRDLSAMRQIIMGHDRQSRPTPATVRFGPADVRWLELEGFRLALDSADPSVSMAILAQGGWEPHLTGVFRRYLRPGMRVVDVGANVGYYTMLAATLAGADGAVMAFEPNSENCRLILMSVAANQFVNVRLFPLALAEAPGYEHFSMHIGSNGGFVSASHALAAGHGTIVPTARLDDLVQPPVDFVKMDVEGAEYRVVCGARALIEAAQPIVSTEFSCEMITRVSRTTPHDFLAFFLSYGYSILMIDRRSGYLQAVPDIGAFLRAWGDPVRIEDLLMLPHGARVSQPV